MLRSVSRSRASLVIAVAAYVAMALSATAAWAGPGYRPDLAKPSIALAAEVPVGVAVDQSSQAIYVAEVSRDLFNLQPGLVEQMSSAGVPSASSPFGTGGQDFFLAVAVNPLTQGVYAYQGVGQTPQGPKGVSKVSVFSATGVLGASFSPPNAEAQSLAVDSSGRLLLPNKGTGSVQIFAPSGALEGEIDCTGCPGDAFFGPQSVALDSAGNLYVVDGRVLRFSPSGGSYAFDSTLQSGEGAVAVAVDSSSNDVFVGELTDGTYHVVAYSSSGVKFDDFGAGLATKSPIPQISGQLAVNATTHRVFLSNPGGGNLWVFERIASIPAPAATVMAPSPVGQMEATLRATVDPKGHALTDCDFEYTDHADFLANGYANAEVLPCPPALRAKEAVVVSANATGLDPATSYDYRIKIASYGGSAESGSQSFQTLPPLPPEATTGTASSLTKTSATLGGLVNPKGATISTCRFDYVTEAGFQSTGFTAASSKACAATPSGNTAISVSAKVTGLVADTAYRFRVVAATGAGTAFGIDKTFATPGETCAENQALCPPPEAPIPAPVEAGLPVLPPLGSAQPKPLKCRKGFRKKRVRGKLKCVRVKKRRTRH